MIQIGRLPGMASICLIHDSRFAALASHEPAFHPYQCVAMKSTRSFPEVSASTWLMKFLIHVRPVLFPWVAGLPRRSDGLSNDGQREIAVVTEMLDWLVLSGSLKPRTVL